MNQTMHQKTSRLNQPFFKISVAVIAIAMLLISVILPVNAATQPVMSVTSVDSGSTVTVQIANLPQNVEFTVTEGASGTAGIGGGLIAHFNSGVGGSQTLTFEIYTVLRAATSVDIRIDSGTGYSASTNFNPTSTTTPVPGTTATPVPGTTATPGATLTPTAVPANPITGVAVSTAGASIRILHVEKGGIVIIEADRFPINTEYKVSIGPGGLLGSTGYLIAHLPIGSSDSYVGTFEIPALVTNSATLDLRIEAPGFLLIQTFNNVNF